MASNFKRGRILYFPFLCDETLSDSHGLPRFYMSEESYEKHCGGEGYEKVEYAEVQYGEWIKSDKEISILQSSRLSEESKKRFEGRHSYYDCSKCGHSILSAVDRDKPKYCGECGCKMKGWQYALN